jgi:NADH-quinone oxidoreductase subunit G
MQLTINDTAVVCKVPNISIYNACYIFNQQLPRFCYNEDLAVAGNCRTCYVEVKNSPKLVVACAIQIADKMHIYTNSPLVKQGRLNSFELILKNHPLDCPICDQGGECDLQEHSFVYATDRTRFFGKKRSNHKIMAGLNIKTQMNRCITCTRCVRYIQTLAPTNNDLNTYGRGEETIIAHIKAQKNHSHLKNIALLCPVGALTYTAKKGFFPNRPWQKIQLMPTQSSPISQIFTKIRFLESFSLAN